MKKFLLAAAIAAIAAAPASAVPVVGATSVRITNAIPTWLQVAEVQAFDFAAVNVALLGTATGSPEYQLAGTPYPTPDKAIDGLTGGIFPSLYHSGTEGADQFLNIVFAAPTNLASLTIFGRVPANIYDVLPLRDVYNYVIYAGDTQLTSGRLDARTGPASVVFVPEPSTWALLLAGLGLLGVSKRRRKTTVAAA